MKLSTFSTRLSSLVAASMAVACGSSGPASGGSNGETFVCPSVGQQYCPDEPAATQAEVDLCNKCYDQIIAVSQCFQIPATVTCGDAGTDEYSTTEADLQKCESVLDAEASCLGEIPAGADGGDTTTTDPGSGTSGGSVVTTNIPITSCQLSANGPAGPDTGSCLGGAVSVIGDYVLLDILGDSSAAIVFPLPQGGLTTGVTYTAPQDPTSFGEEESLTIDQSGYTCEVSVGDTDSDPNMPWTTAGVAVSVVFSAYDVANQVVHGTLSATSPCWAGSGDSASTPLSTGATLTVTF